MDNVISFDKFLNKKKQESLDDISRKYGQKTYDILKAVGLEEETIHYLMDNTPISA